MSATTAAALPHSEERRRFQRVKVNILGRYMTPDRREYPCQVVDMSPGGTKVIAPTTCTFGDRVIIYLDHIGRIEGIVVRTFEGGFGIKLSDGALKRDKLAAQLTWLANRHERGLPEDRRHERMVPRNPSSHIEFSDGRTYPCRVIDMSLSGAAVSCEVRPAIGVPVTLSKMKGRVVRHFDGGFAIEFATVQAHRNAQNEPQRAALSPARPPPGPLLSRFSGFPE